MYTVIFMMMVSQPVSAVFCPTVFFYDLQALNSNASYKKREQVQQANFF